ncbi:unnamed protein product [Cyclocybe aegerita]|uniref:GATA-type domain-containing protein n=1 Tax=Cyclocybe aegerita TaxID=1973307 RepID=A0A8S0WBG9_CYCAE|nr:unnamed protein product [Cyclocybe aegerita]
MPMFGGDSTKSSDEEHHDHPDAVIDPALRKLASGPRSDKRGQEAGVGNHKDQPSMPTRVEPSFQMSSPFVSSPALCSDARLFNVSSLDRRRQHQHQFDSNARIPSPPPPIATIPQSHSPSPSVVSVDRSSNSTPHIRRSPPSNTIQQQQSMYSSSYHAHPHDLQSVNRQHQQQQQHPYAPRGEPINHHPHPHQYMYSPHPPPPFDPPRFDQHHPHPQHDTRLSFRDSQRRNTCPTRPRRRRCIARTQGSSTPCRASPRRRCFNCCTTDTSTWRRSNLSPGKVLCNKCGLFERTHSRPRPDQFPHKRGPLASSALRGRTPPGQQFNSLNGPHNISASSGNNQTQLPPIGGVGAGAYGYNDYGHGQQGQGGQQGLPTLQSWHGNGSSSGPSASSGPVPSSTSAGNAPSSTTNGNGSGANPPTNGSSPPGAHKQQQQQESPRLQTSTSTSSSSKGVKYEDGVKYEEGAQGQGARSHPPSPPSRSSTAAGGGSGGKAGVNGVAGDEKGGSRDA